MGSFYDYSNTVFGKLCRLERAGKLEWEDCGMSGKSGDYPYNRTVSDIPVRDVQVDSGPGFTVKHGESKQQFSSGAKRDTAAGKTAYSLIPKWVTKRLADHLTKGAEHYGGWNWSKGIPIDRTYDSLQRHIEQWMDNDRSEDHFAAIIFNIMVMEQTRQLVFDGKLPAEHLGSHQTYPGGNKMAEDFHASR